MLDDYTDSETRPADPARRAFRDDLIAGLSADTKSIPCKYFYDAAGCDLFDRICQLPEYYVTRTEMALLAERAGDLADILGRHARIVEFGAGAGEKVCLLLDALDQPAAYVPVDVAQAYLDSSCRALALRYPGLDIHPICADFNAPIPLPFETGAGCNVVGFFPGSTIGNLAPDEACGFLRHAGDLVGKDGALVIGVDLKKAPDILHAAYNDGQGVTAAFNLNLLARANRELAADFHLPDFAHCAHYNEGEGRVEMHLVSRIDQDVSIGATRIAFAQGETIHTENSYKYSLEEFHDLAAQAGLAAQAAWTDDNDLFSLHLLRHQT